MTFEEWKTAIDVILLAKLGCTQDDLPDWLARDAFDDEVTPEEAAEYIIEEMTYGEEEDEDDYDDSMDGDTASALASAGWGTDEDYGSF